MKIKTNVNKITSENVSALSVTINHAETRKDVA